MDQLEEKILQTDQLKNASKRLQSLTTHRAASNIDLVSTKGLIRIRI